jgi:ATP-dependent DNA helicase RecQ
MLRREPERAAKPPRARKAAEPAADLSAEAAVVFERLRTWRYERAKEQGVPAYVVFTDATLREIATTLPSSLAELSKVSGIGETKLARYGQQVLDVLTA